MESFEEGRAAGLEVEESEDVEAVKVLREPVEDRLDGVDDLIRPAPPAAPPGSGEGATGLAPAAAAGR